MKAAVIDSHGSVENVHVTDVPAPQAGPGEVIVEVRAAALNHLDIWVCDGRGSLNLPMPHVLGSDAAGVIATKADDVRGVQVGDEVIINPGLSCSQCEFCRSGQQSLCTTFGIVGLSRPGTFAEQVAVPAGNVYPKPADMSFPEAAALGLAHVTAWRMLIARAGLVADQSVLIHGVGGGVALAALQLAKCAGAEVIVTSSSDEKLTRAGQLGADHMVNYRAVEDVAERVREITAGRGVDLAVDTVGAATWSIDFQAVRRGGKVVLCGVTTGAEAPTSLRSLYWNQLTILGSTMGSDEDFRQMLRAVRTAGLKPVIDSVRPLSNAREAMQRMAGGEQFGKIVLDIRA